MLKLMVLLFSFVFSLSAQAQSTADSCIIYVPKILSANGDCFDCHKLRIGTDCDFEEFEFLLFNRWGNILFETSNPAFEFEPTELKDGIYTYRITGKTKSGERKVQSGSITFLK